MTLRRAIAVWALAGGLCAPAYAQDQAAPPESRAVAAQERALAVPVRPGAATGLSFLGLAQLKATGSNLEPTNPFLDGQILGTLGGLNGVEVGETLGFGTEQRVTGFFTYAPKILDGQVSLTAGFEIDHAFGDQSYGSGGNVGGAYGADMVNVQTRRLHLTLRPDLGAQHSLSVVLGQQFLADGALDPTRAAPDDLFRSGGRLMFWGSEATGVSVYGRHKGGWSDRVRYRLGAYTLYERGFAVADDVWLLMADAQLNPLYATQVGLHAWTLRDRSGGQQGILGVGPASVLSELQGGARLDFPAELGDPDAAAPEVSADLSWLGLDVGYNHTLRQGPVGLSAAVFANLGQLYARGLGAVPVRGLLADAELRWRYLPGEGSVVRLEGLFSTADTAGDGTYNGIFTGNSYGVVGAVYASHGCLLLFPDLFSINRQVSAVYDVSGAGRGLVALTGGVGWDPIPDRLTVGIGGGHARNPGGEAIGTELNAKVVAEPWLFLRTGLWGAVLLPGEAALVDRPALAAYLGLDWLVF